MKKVLNVIYRRMKINMNYFFKSIIFNVLGIINRLVRKEQESIFFLPHPNCQTDNYDIINYKSDNVLCMFNSIIRDNRYNNYTLIVASYESKKKEKYQQYVLTINPKVSVSFINANDRIEVVKAFMRSHICLTDNAHYNFKFKTNRQFVICLSYFSSFKDNYLFINALDRRKFKMLSEISNNSFDIHLATSNIFSRIQSIDMLISYSKFVVSGFPRNDIFYVDNTNVKDAIYEKTGFFNSSIICYTPTFRDYERMDLSLGDPKLCVKKGIFGNISNEDYLKFEAFLEENDIILIYKIHPWQEKNVLLSKSAKRIINYNMLRTELGISLYDVLSVSDLLITDYTSTYFDFLHKNKPVIFYFYDYEKYRINRGFSFNPIETVCGGDIVYDYNGLMKSIEHCLLDGCDDNNKRHYIHDLMNTHHDGHSCERVKKIIQDVMNGMINSRNAWQCQY